MKLLSQMDVIHSVNDTVENLDLVKMEQISHLLGSYIVDICKREELTVTKAEIPMVTQSGPVPSNEIVDIGTCKVIEVDGKRKHLSEFIYNNKLGDNKYIFSTRCKNQIFQLKKI